jgi:hypothetical protein
MKKGKVTRNVHKTCAEFQNKMFSKNQEKEVSLREKRIEILKITGYWSIQEEDEEEEERERVRERGSKICLKKADLDILLVCTEPSCGKFLKNNCFFHVSETLMENLQLGP